MRKRKTRCHYDEDMPDLVAMNDWELDKYQDPVEAKRSHKSGFGDCANDWRIDF